MSELAWFKSSFSDSDNACVEVAVSADGVKVRDSKDRGGPVLVFTPEEWRAFAAGAAAGEFDI